MEFNFDIKFLAGVKNNVADAFSRLCINNRLEWKHRVEANTAVSDLAHPTRPNRKKLKNVKNGNFVPFRGKKTIIHVFICRICEV